MWPPPPSSRACSRRAPRSRATSLPTPPSATPRTRTSSRAPRRSGRPSWRPGSAPSAPRSARPWRRRPDGRLPTPISAWFCCSPPSRARRCAQARRCSRASRPRWPRRPWRMPGTPTWPCASPPPPAWVGWDAIAREYATDYRTTFEIGAPALRRALADDLPWRDAVVEAYLTLLATAADTHIARKLGLAAAVTVQQRGRAVLSAGGVRTTAGREAIAALDRELRDDAHTLNPGATADLCGAAVYAVLLEGGWRGRA